MNIIHHVAIICSDKDAAVDFYVNKLGFPVISLLGWQAGFTAGMAYHIIERGLLRSDLHNASAEVLAALVDEASKFAQCCAQSADNCITPQFAQGKRAALEKAQQLRDQAAQK